MTCFYGDCSACHKSIVVCTNDTLEGVMILWLPKHIREVSEILHPWKRICYDQDLDKLVQCSSPLWLFCVEGAWGTGVGGSLSLFAVHEKQKHRAMLFLTSQT